MSFSRKKLLLFLFVFIVLAAGFCFYHFYQRWIYHGIGPGFKEKIVPVSAPGGGDAVDSNEDSENNDKNVLLTFLTVGHIRHMRYSPGAVMAKKVPLLGELFTGALPLIKRLDPDFIFVTGDVLPLASYNPFNESPRDIEKERSLFDFCWDRVFEELEGIDSKIIILPGNHEYFNPVSAAVFKRRVGDFYGSVFLGDVRFVWLNSCRTETRVKDAKKYAGAADITGDQLALLRRGFSTEPEGWRERNIFLFVHHSPFGIGNWKKDIEPLIRGRCTAVFSGTRSGTLRYRERGGVGYFNGGFDTKGLTPSYMVLTTVYRNGNIKYTVYPVLSPTIFGKLKMILAKLF
jgi:hypothetical protein